ncbi:50S ribosomal protein L4 [Patescibacteria group bacterium]|nr:50S ribosomal protein L4 [Patescibacteria group bacterium]
MKVDIYSYTGKKVADKITVKDKVFKSDIRKDLTDRFAYIHLVNCRQGTAFAKDRAQVSGTGRKARKNSRLGLSRIGDKRSNIFTKGGVAHGPKGGIFSLKMPQKVRRMALYSSLSEKLSNKDILFIDKIVISDKTPRVKQALKILEKLNISDSKVLIVTDKKDEILKKSFSNIQNIKLLPSPFITSYDILNYRKILILKDSLDNIPGYKDV